MAETHAVLRDLDIAKLSEEYRAAKPFPHLVIDSLVDEDFARRVADAFPTFEQAAEGGGVGFESVNETGKLQLTDYSGFPGPVKALADALASPAFLKQIEAITGIEGLEWDDTLAGGGLHQTRRSGLLDVHVDFNTLGERFRRLNILVYLNEGWKEEWGGALELWDRKVRVKHQHVLPSLGRAVIFETSEWSFHGVTAVTCPPDIARKSFAAYYYTKTPPPWYDGRDHSTIFKARPNERAKRYIFMPAQAAKDKFKVGVWRVKQTVRGFLDN